MVDIHHLLTAFLGEGTTLRRGKNIERHFRGAAELYALLGDHQRPVDQNWMRHHGVEQPVIGERRIAQAQRVLGCALLAQHVSHSDAGLVD
jgi:hypothetical protein